MKSLNKNITSLNGVYGTDFGSEIGTDAPAPYQSSNEGGIIAADDSLLTVVDQDAPRLVIRGKTPNPNLKTHSHH